MSYTPGINISADSTVELGANIIGPERVFHDLGKDNGDLVRSGNATVMRFATAVLFLPSQGAPVALTPLPLAIPDFIFALAFAANETVVASNDPAMTTTDGLVGFVNKTGYGGSPYDGVYSCSTSYLTANTAIGDASVGGYTGSVGNYLAMGSQGFRAGTIPGYPTWNTFELKVTGTNTLRLSHKWYLGGPTTAAALKAQIDTAARTAITDPGCYLNITTSTLTAKQYLASFPYFLVQWPVATSPLTLMHSRSYVA